MNAKEIYQNFLEDGDLLILYPYLSGVWEQDEETFIKDYELNKEALKDGEKMGKHTD